MTSGFRFFFQSAPWYAWALSIPLLLLFKYIWFLLACILVFWSLRTRKVWKFSAGWTVPYRHRPTIAIKPPRLLAQTDRSIGKIIFIEEPDPIKRMEHIVCHELTHAFSASLKLPLWLNEGLAMLTVDKLFGRPTVRPETLQALNSHRFRKLVGKYGDIPSMNKETLAYHYVRGYWLTRFLRDNHPTLLNELLERRHRHRALVKKLATALGISYGSFWKTIDEKVIEHFREDPLLGGQGECSEKVTNVPSPGRSS